MIDWHAEQSDKFIGTAAAIASVIAAGAGAGASIYGAHKQADSAKEAAKTQTDAAKYGADKQDAATQRAEAFQRQQAENAWQNQQLVQRANYDQWKARQGTIAGVASQYGIQAPAIPDYVAGVDPHFENAAPSTPGAPAAGPAGGSTPSAFLKGLLDQGLDPQAAAQRTNSQFKLGTGTEAKYYAPSARTSGKAVIGLPDSYISQEPTGWSVTQRGASEGAKAPAAGTISAYGMAAPTLQTPRVNTAIPMPYAMGTIGAFQGRVR